MATDKLGAERGKMAEKTPKYISVYHMLKTEILSGTYNTGEHLPAETQLMETFRVSRTTIRQAISLLKEEGLVEVRQGHGTRVTHADAVATPFGISGPLDSERITITNRFPDSDAASPTTQAAFIDIVRAEVHVAQALNLKVGNKVFRLQRVKLIHNTIFAYVVSYVPIDTAPGLEQHSGTVTHLYHFLEKEYGITLNSIEDTISAVPATFFEAKVLNVEVGSPLLLSTRTASANGVIFDYSKRYIRPDLYNLSIAIEEPEMSGHAAYQEEVLPPTENNIRQYRRKHSMNPGKPKAIIRTEERRCRYDRIIIRQTEG